MDIFFTDPTAIPLPPEDVRIRALSAEPYPDRRRVKTTLEIDPFQLNRRPSLELTAFNAAGDELASVVILETLDRQFSLTMHLRGDSAGPLTLRAVLFYSAQLPKPEPGTAPLVLDMELPERTTIDRREITFQV